MRCFKWQLLKKKGKIPRCIWKLNSHLSKLDQDGVAPCAPEPDVRLAFDGVQGAAAPLPHQLPLHTGWHDFNYILRKWSLKHLLIDMHSPTQLAFMMTLFSVRGSRDPPSSWRPSPCRSPSLTSPPTATPLLTTSSIRFSWHREAEDLFRHFWNVQRNTKHELKKFDLNY